MAAFPNAQLPTRKYGLGFALSGEALKYFKYWILAAVLLSFLGPLVLSRSSDIDLSTWFYTANVAKWFTAFIGGGFIASLVPTMIAAGLTRRELSVAHGVFGLLWSAAIGVLVIAGLLVERAYYDAMGWAQGVQGDDSVIAIGSWGETAAFASVYPLMYLVYFAAGVVVGAASYRWEGTGWLILVPILPVVFSLDNAVYNTEPFGPAWAGVFGRFIDEWGTGLVLIGIAVVTLVLVVAAHRIIIDIPLRSKKA
ncbi:hypothetical protein K3N28_15195 [Glycomyces sp. TRM65418]|uniref:hypothetical protein n=1 Tax=Glycomyces sp. TRM65418 TaxID=2867006 RepID=UPI001CE6BD8E|nr:hypothetical protein [Glycomyces sp. TRM65418]MCC3764411.1 hypothetical protein [Glycomyces sp. TRM65418]QZD54087.1 hypothetical protein K3N28_15120 [Glycomyces sp. TRM65418]